MCIYLIKRSSSFVFVPIFKSVEIVNNIIIIKTSLCKKLFWQNLRYIPAANVKTTYVFFQTANTSSDYATHFYLNTYYLNCSSKILSECLLLYETSIIFTEHLLYLLNFYYIAGHLQLLLNTYYFTGRLLFILNNHYFTKQNGINLILCI